MQLSNLVSMYLLHTYFEKKVQVKLSKNNLRNLGKLNWHKFKRRHIIVATYCNTYLLRTELFPLSDFSMTFTNDKDKNENQA